MRFPGLVTGFRQIGVSSITAMQRYFSHGTGANWGASFGLAAWVGANRAIYLPFELEQPILITELWIANGAVAGNVDVGLYTADGTRLVSAGTTAMAGANQIQRFTIASHPVLGRGTFFMAMAASSIAATFNAFTAAGAQDFHVVWGTLQQTTALPLPATATFATNASTAYIPLIGLAARLI